MKDLLVLLAHLLTTLAKLLGPGGTRAVVADNILMRQQLLVINRSRQRAPNLSPVPIGNVIRKLREGGRRGKTLGAVRQGNVPGGAHPAAENLWGNLPTGLYQ